MKIFIWYPSLILPLILGAVEINDVQLKFTFPRVLWSQVWPYDFYSEYQLQEWEMCLRHKYNIHSTFPNAFFCYLLAGETFGPECRSILKWQIIKIVTNTWNCPAASIHRWHSDCILSEEHFSVLCPLFFAFYEQLCSSASLYAYSFC